jgi:hypothetical protein
MCVWLKTVEMYSFDYQLLKTSAGLSGWPDGLCVSARPEGMAMPRHTILNALQG